MALYLIGNGPMQTTAAFAKVTTGTAIKTMLQVKLGAAVNGAHIVEWGCSFDASTAATPGQIELIETGTVFATVTASAQADISYLDPDALVGSINQTTNIFAVGTAATGYTATAEGTITTVRNFDIQMVAPTNQYMKQFPLGREPFLQPGNAGRIRMTFGTAVNAYCYMILEV